MVAVVALGLMAVAVVGARAWQQHKTDDRTRARFAQLSKDPLLAALGTRFGRRHDGPVLLRCQQTPDDDSLPPQFEVDFPAPQTPAAQTQVTAAARGAGWSVRTWERGTGRSHAYYFELRKSFGTWTSDSDAALDRTGLSLDMTASDAGRCA
ncbi:hypothetical protein ACFWPQ_21945 [Streptomyces sp. NPDC058464]|uniref:hypothetical protein n=1 Tax=Streptomyces sp. NPDC058464 TaxID=3346511 RepID=UPI00365BBA95